VQVLQQVLQDVQSQQRRLADKVNEDEKTTRKMREKQKEYCKTQAKFQQKLARNGFTPEVRLGRWSACADYQWRWVFLDSVSWCCRSDDRQHQPGMLACAAWHVPDRPTDCSFSMMCSAAAAIDTHYAELMQEPVPLHMCNSTEHISGRVHPSCICNCSGACTCTSHATLLLAADHACCT
jgi:hypothetical protein